MATLPAPPAKGSGDELTAVTRHLCTGAYVDEHFRDLVIDKVCTSPHRRVAPSYGFDIVPVMRHAWRAATLTAVLRITLLGSVIAPTCAGALPASVLVACGLALLWLLRLGLLIHRGDRELRIDRKTAPRNKERQHWQRVHQRRLQQMLPRRRSEKSLALQRVGSIALAVATTGLALALIHPRDATAALHVGAALMLMCLAIGAIRQLQLNRILRAPTLRPARLSRRQRVADVQQEDVHTVYRRPRHNQDKGVTEDDLTVFTLFGRESPFIGAGEIVYQWNPPMSVQLLRPVDDDDAPLQEREHLVPPFQAHELVEHLRQAVRLLNTDSHEVRLPAQVRDRVYVSETDVATDRSLLPQQLTDADLRDIINTPGSRGHHFLEVTTPLEGAEYVATVLLHVSVRGRTLIISTAACVLAHTPRSFQRTAEFGQHGLTAVVSAAFRELFALPEQVERSWRIIRYLQALVRAAVLPADLTSTPIPNVLIGSRVSIREESAQAWSKVQLEKTDILGRMKTIEQRLLRAAGDFLLTKDVDASEFNNRALKIINSGIFNFGDNNTISNNAVGDAAQVGALAHPATAADGPGEGGAQ
ncbi:hypothetical protein LG634_01660 [Streptomyces bambusae]|uniref:hypothetical protein n=1 Tax=Streptomyces bambusae TaxID=1550616 RepID=UPI001CFF24D1|nr:hypothetical protein [Streptomyces bambusae]MCB5163556.1 hypothetical protein [Streptomyces bambusae]